VVIFAEKQISHSSSKKKIKREEDDLEMFANLISQSSVQLHFIVQDLSKTEKSLFSSIQS
jgi:biotin synthase-related radical SAM superfamily protein